MVRLSEFLTRRRWWVLAAWLALPLSSKQTERLVGGGFTVPGSQSQSVEDSLANDFPPSAAAGIGAVLEAAPDATQAQIDAGFLQDVAAFLSKSLAPAKVASR